MIGTAEYQLAKWIYSYINKHVPNEHAINSTKIFIDKFTNFNISAGDFCVSFDVESLYTNVPLREVIDNIANFLFDNNVEYFPQKKELKRNQKTFTKSILKKLMYMCTEGMFL